MTPEATGLSAILLLISKRRHAPLITMAANPSQSNGLRKLADVMVDKPQTVAREKIDDVFGHLAEENMLAVSGAPGVLLGVF